MKKYSDLEFLRLNKLQRFFYKFALFFAGLGHKIVHFFVNVWLYIKKFGLWIAHEVTDIIMTFVHGDGKTRVSYLVMGYGSIRRGQWGRGLLFFLFEVVFILYMIFWGGAWLSKFNTLGTEGVTYEYDEILDQNVPVYHDNSFKIMLYSVLSIFFVIALIYTWRLNIKQNKIALEITHYDERIALKKECKQKIKELDQQNYLEEEKQAKKVELKEEYAQKIESCGKPLKSTKDDLRSLVDDQFHKTLLALPLTGIILFTVMPILFMILVAFTNYDGAHNGYTNNLFTWVGFDNFNTLLGWKSGGNKYAAAFGEILGWTILWAFLATFSNYFLGMFVAIMINKKGIKLKKLWRTILVLTIAIPQFISLMYVSKMFADNGFIINFLRTVFKVPDSFSFIGSNANPWVARVTIVVINIWIGIPYLMLIATGILMNIPEDLYESAKIDGANVWQQYTKITLPYMIFITGPYLLTSFIGNMNNFNVIYLLTGGGPKNTKFGSIGGGVGHTDLLITWLFKITTGAESQYYMGSVIGILVFVVIAVLSLIVYNVMPSTKNEEDYQ